MVVGCCPLESYFIKCCRGVMEDLLVEQSTAWVSKLPRRRPYAMSLKDS